MSGLAKVTILRTSGATEEHEIGKHILLDWIKRMIGADWIDTVDLRDGRVLIVDDYGWDCEVREIPGGVEFVPVRPLKPVNPQATALYHRVCRPGTTHQIAGDAAVALDRDFA